MDVDIARMVQQLRNDGNDEAADLISDLQHDCEVQALACIDLMEGSTALGEAYAALTAELEAARRDAARYEWLRNTDDISPLFVELPDDSGFRFIRGDELDAAIDAAIAQTVALVPVPVKEGPECVDPACECQMEHDYENAVRGAVLPTPEAKERTP